MSAGWQLIGRGAGLLWVALSFAGGAGGQSDAGKKGTWHTIEFAIVKLNDVAPISWNMYHTEKKGVLLLRLWKRYLLINLQDQEVFDMDPQKIKVTGDTVEWSRAEIPEKPIDTPDWRERNIGTMERIRFRLCKDCHYLELQIPLGPTGRPIY